jgi:hypothetical protein
VTEPTDTESTSRVIPQLRVCAQLVDEARSHAARTSGRGTMLDQLSVALGVGATALAAIAAVTVIPKSATWVTGVTAGLSALVSGLRTAFNPAARARTYHGIGLRWKRLGDDGDGLIRWVEAELQHPRLGLGAAGHRPTMGAFESTAEFDAQVQSAVAEEAEKRLKPLQDRRDSLLEEETGSSETVLERAERAFAAAEQSARATTDAVTRATLDYVRGLADDVSPAAEGAIRRMLAGAVPNDAIDDVVGETDDRVRDRLRSRNTQFSSLLAGIAPSEDRGGPKYPVAAAASQSPGQARRTLADRGIVMSRQASP